MKIVKPYLFLFILFIQCQKGGDKEVIEKYVAKHAWKYGEGANIGDWIDFKTGLYTIRKDTIVRNDSTVAIVSHLKEAKPGDDAEMKIKLVKDSSTGIYYAK